MKKYKKVKIEKDIHGDGRRVWDAYLMPVPPCGCAADSHDGHPGDVWAAITTYEDSPVPCPIAGCSGKLQWAEAGYVPGYRICDVLGRGDGRVRGHHFIWVGDQDEEDNLVLIHDACCDDIDEADAETEGD